MLISDSLEQQASEAQTIINSAGINLEQNILQPSYTPFQIPQAISVAYMNQLGRFGVEENLCGFSYASTDNLGVPAALDSATDATLFASAGGIPPDAGISLVYNNSASGNLHGKPAIIVTDCG